MKILKLFVAATCLLLSFSTYSAEKIYFVQSDHLGTPEVLTDENQAVVWRAGDDPFGDSAPSVEQIVFNVRFPGQYYDVESGLHYNWNRYYDPSIGRYVTSDPIGLDGGMNTFGYVVGNPNRYYDFNGLQIAGTAGEWGGDLPLDDILDGAGRLLGRIGGVLAMCLSLSGDSQQHRGRIQAQGDGYEDSESWHQFSPLTVADGYAKLDALVARMPPRVKVARAIAIEKARSWIGTAAAAGGVNAQISKTFMNPGARRGARIDIEVRAGKAFVP